MDIPSFLLVTGGPEKMAYELRAFNTRKTKKRQLLVHARKRNGAVRIGTVVGGKKKQMAKIYSVQVSF